MTTVIITMNNSKQYKGFICNGHAGFAKRTLFFKQPDILCSSISTLVINTINSLEQIAGEHANMTCETDESIAHISCRFQEPVTNEKSIVLLDAMVLGLTELSKEYGSEYLQVKFEEV